MTHRSRILMAVLAAVLAGNAAASGLGGTLGGAGKFALGLSFERINKQDLDFDSGNFTRSILGAASAGDFPELDHQILSPEMDSSRLFLEGSIGVHPRVDVFVKLGGASSDADYGLSEPGISNDAHHFKGDSDFAFGLGLRAKLYEHDNGLRVMGRLEYFKSDADADARVNGIALSQHVVNGLIDAGASNVTAGGSADTDLEEFRAALVVGKDFGNFTPYAGVEYRYTDLTLDASVTGSEDLGPFAYSLHQKYEADDKFGLLLGVDADIDPNLALNAEVGFIYGTGFRVGGEWRF